MTLKQRLLASISLHRKVDILGLYKTFPHESKIQILRNLFILQNEGWVKIRKYRTIDGINSYNPNVRKSNKNMFKQLDLL